MKYIFLSLLSYTFVLSFIASTATIASPKNKVKIASVARSSVGPKPPSTPFICQNLSATLTAKCNSELVKSKAIIEAKLPNIQEKIPGFNCYSSKKRSSKIVSQVRIRLRKYLLEEDFSKVILSYINMGMCHWSANNFVAAKSFVDFFPELVPVLNLVKPDGLLLGSGRVLRNDLSGQKWWLAHQHIRFMENTLRTKHSYLCDTGGCKESAWKMTQFAISRHYYDILLSNFLSNHKGNSGFIENFEIRQKLQSQIALIKIANSVKILADSSEYLRELKKISHVLSQTLYQISPEFRNLDAIGTIDLQTIRRLMRSNEHILVYIHAIECRQSMIWSIKPSGPAKLGRTGGSHQNCTTSDLKEKIAQVQKIFRQSASAQDANHAIKWLSKVLIEPVKLPAPGAKLLILVDEAMAGIPFEFLLLKSGKRLGEEYDVRYLPSLAAFARHRSQKPIVDFRTVYIGISLDEHSNEFSALNSSEFIRKTAQFYRGVSLLEAMEAEIYASEDISNAKYVHFLTHSAFSEGRLDLVYKAGAGEDGLVSAEEVVSHLQLSADTVLITSCDSTGARLSLPPGEALSDLINSFSIVGAKNIIATRWPITERMAKVFTTEYLMQREQNDRSLAEAVRLARQKLFVVFKGKPEAWAAWAVIGG